MVNITSKDNVIKIVGEVDIATAKEFEDALLELIEKKYPVIVLDLTDMDYIDSTGIGILMNTKRNILPEDQEIVLYRPKRSITKILKLTGVEKVFSVKK